MIFLEYNSDPCFEWFYLFFLIIPYKFDTNLTPFLISFRDRELHQREGLGGYFPMILMGPPRKHPGNVLHICLVRLTSVLCNQFTYSTRVHATGAFYQCTCNNTNALYTIILGMFYLDFSPFFLFRRCLSILFFFSFSILHHFEKFGVEVRRRADLVLRRSARWSYLDCLNKKEYYFHMRIPIHNSHTILKNDVSHQKKSDVKLP